MDSGLKASQLRVCRNHVLVRPDRAPNKTASGLVLPSDIMLPPGTATVIRVGEKAREHMQPGDRIAYRWIDGYLTEINCEGQELKFLQVDQILGVLPKEQEAA